MGRTAREPRILRLEVPGRAQRWLTESGTTNLGFRSEVAVDVLEDAPVVCNEGGDVMAANVAPSTPAVVAVIVQDEVEALGQQRPERVVHVCREPAAVAHDQSRTIRIAVSSEYDEGTVRSADIGCRQRFWQVPAIYHDADFTNGPWCATVMVSRRHGCLHRGLNRPQLIRRNVSSYSAPGSWEHVCDCDYSIHSHIVYGKYRE